MCDAGEIEVKPGSLDRTRKFGSASRRLHLGKLTVKSTKVVEDRIESIHMELDPLRNQVTAVTHNVEAVQSTLLPATKNFQRQNLPQTLHLE